MSDEEAREALKSQFRRECSRKLEKVTRIKPVLTPTAIHELDDLVTELIAVEALPLSLVNSFEFKTLCKTLNPDYKPPSRWKLAGI